MVASAISCGPCWTTVQVDVNAPAASGRMGRPIRALIRVDLPRDTSPATMARTAGVWVRAASLSSEPSVALPRTGVARSRISVTR